MLQSQSSNASRTHQVSGVRGNMTFASARVVLLTMFNTNVNGTEIQSREHSVDGERDKWKEWPALKSSHDAGTGQILLTVCTQFCAQGASPLQTDHFQEAAVF